MGFFRERVHSAGVDPAVVEIEQGTRCDGEVDGFIVPANGVERLYVFRRDSRRIVVDFVHETKQGFVFFIEARGFEVSEHTPYKFFAAQQFRRNCGVGFQSKRTIVSV